MASSQYIISRPLPNAVTYELHPTFTLVTLPSQSTWISGLHFHTTYSEKLSVLRGTVEVEIYPRPGDETPPGSSSVRTLTAGESFHIPIYTRHSWRRAHPNSEEVVVRESTDPADGLKGVFFWSLNSIILQNDQIERVKRSWVMRYLGTGWTIEVRLAALFWEMDNWPVTLKIGGQNRSCALMEEMTTRSVLLGARGLVWMCGLDTVDESSLPGWIGEAWNGRGTRKRV